ncbi:hypothetical protein [Chitinimonas lacunae]|uniref:MarR family transcriptional regulator n=1 Tax=Chitinimonas lacunae TaxID=1963018 RepID=A0ABV8MYE5_9NEIS
MTDLDRLLSLFSGRDPLTAGHIAQQMGIALDAAQQLLNAARKAGRLRLASGVVPRAYRLPDENPDSVPAPTIPGARVIAARHPQTIDRPMVYRQSPTEYLYI